MWTPRRCGLFAVSLLVLLSGYVGYARSFVGGIDGLPALPEKYRPGETVTTPPPPLVNTVEARIRQAFGNDAPEQNRPIRLEMRNQNMVLAAGRFDIEDGRVRLAPVSIALFGKDKNDGKGLEINTIKAEVAFLRFDKPVASPQDLNGRTVTEAELRRNIEIVNNRRTPDRGDDLCIYIADGPLFYTESNHLVRTADSVHLKDLQSKPKPVQVWGKGMEVELIAEAPPVKPGQSAPKKKQDSITGVRRIILQSDVEMFLYVDGHSGFPGGDQAAQGPPPAADGSDKAEVVIRTPGRFNYLLGNNPKNAGGPKEPDQARFDIPEAVPGRPPRAPQHVTVDRHQKDHAHPDVILNDHLVCEHLELELRRKEGGKDGAAASPTESLDRGLEIDWARATGKEVVVTSDGEKLEAHGREFTYDARTQTTTLRGVDRWFLRPEPIEAVKEDSVIHARDLVMVRKELPAPKDAGKAAADPKAPPAKTTYQEATARGPGRIDMANNDNKEKKSDKKTVHAYWSDLLTSTRDGPYDLLTLTGNARFVDEESDQTLDGDLLKVWLGEVVVAGEVGPPDPAAAPPKADASSSTGPSAQGKKPHHVESVGNVLAHSKSLNVHDTARLVIKFKDVPPETLPANGPRGPAAPPPAKPDVGPPAPGGAAPRVVVAPAAPQTPVTPAPAAQPPVTAAPAEPPAPTAETSAVSGSAPAAVPTAPPTAPAAAAAAGAARAAASRANRTRRRRRNAPSTSAPAPLTPSCSAPATARCWTRSAARGRWSCTRTRPSRTRSRSTSSATPSTCATTSRATNWR